MAEYEDHPVLTGLVALVGVGLVVGLILGGAALFTTQMLGLDGGDGGVEATSGASMYLPTPKETPPPSEPLITLAPGQTQTQQPSPTAETSAPPEEITLSVGQTEVSPMERIDLTGVYPGGEGAILQVERLAGSSWTEFPVTTSVTNETFATYVQTGQLGVSKFRMRDTESGRVSNVVTVTIG